MVSLLDIYPTLNDLLGLPQIEGLEGHSLLPQLSDPEVVRPWPAITTHNQGNHAVRSVRWRYIQYADGSEEFYDLQSDPQEFDNVAGESRYAALIAEHRRWLPKVDAPPASGSAHRILTYDPASDTAVWQGKVIDDERGIGRFARVVGHQVFIGPHRVTVIEIVLHEGVDNNIRFQVRDVIL